MRRIPKSLLPQNKSSEQAQHLRSATKNYEPHGPSAIPRKVDFCLEANFGSMSIDVTAKIIICEFAPIRVKLTNIISDLVGSHS
jgi:hypothetical protein